MLNASTTLDPAFRIAPVNRRTFGSFVEHLGRSVYTGIYEPDHPSADADGLRTDVLELVRELGISTVRYPGGNFVSAYRWEDGVGPKQERPRRLDLAWRATETNRFGLEEFMRWAEKAGVEPMLAVNLGTRGVQEALDLLEYTNYPGGTHYSDLRARHGRAEPYGVGMWCLGNEMDGPWQIGHKTPREYARIAAETARAMRFVQPDLELVACGSSGFEMPTFGTWERTVLEETYDLVDYISLHAYYWERGGDLASFLACAQHMDDYIEAAVATADGVRADLKRDKRIQISFDEWNVWYMAPNPEPWKFPEGLEDGQRWPEAPRQLEDIYNVADAVVVGNLLISLLRHSDRVTAACQAQLVNVIGPIFTEPGGRAWRQSIFHPFALTSAAAAGDVLRCEVTCPRTDTAERGEVALVDTVATVDDAEGAAAVFVVNRSTSEEVAFEVDIRGIAATRVVDCLTLADADAYAVNTADDPDRVAPRDNTSIRLEDGRLTATLPPVSWTRIRLATT